MARYLLLKKIWFGIALAAVSAGLFVINNPSVFAKYDSYNIILNQAQVDKARMAQDIPFLLPTASAVPTVLPTHVPQPTPKLNERSTKFDFDLALTGIGSTSGNLSPLFPQRTLTVEVIDGLDRKVLEKKGFILWDGVTQTFYGTIDMGNTLNTGTYTVKVKTDRYLRKAFPNTQIAKGGLIVIPTASLIVGDINGDNLLDVQDYNLYVSCYKDRANTIECGKNKTNADLNDDGKNDSETDLTDYKLLFGSLKVQKGD